MRQYENLVGGTGDKGVSLVVVITQDVSEIKDSTIFIGTVPIGVFNIE